MTKLLLAIALLASGCANRDRPTAALTTESPGPVSSDTPSASPRLCPNQAQGEGIDASVLLAGSRLGAHGDYDSLVFEFKGADQPSFVASPAKRPLTQDASGEPIEVEGETFVSISLGATGVDSSKDYAPTYKATSRMKVGSSAAIVEVAQAGDFEGRTLWYVGLKSPACYRVSKLNSPTRLVFDFSSS